MDKYVSTLPIIKRSTVLKLADYKKMVNCCISISDVYNLMENEYIRKSIFIASPHLYTSIVNHSGNPNKIVKSFMKYYIRMCTRTTPYANFSYTTILNCDSEESDYKSYIRVDDCWIAELIEKILKSGDELDIIQVRLNPSLRICQHTVEIFNRSIYENNETLDDFQSIIRTEEFKLIERKCKKNYISIPELRESMMQYCDSNKFDSYVRELIYKGFLITNLDITISGKDRLNYLIDMFSCTNHGCSCASKIRNIQSLVRKANECAFDQGIDYLIKAQIEMGKIAKSSQYFDCVLVKNTECDQVCLKKYENVPKLLEIMREIYLNTASRLPFQTYQNRFMQKYGRDREVQLTELISSNQLGMPEEDSFDGCLNMGVNRYSKQFNRLLDDAYISNSYEVDLQKMAINDDNKNKNNSKKTPNFTPSIEMFFVDGFVGKKNVDNEYIYCSPNIGSRMQGNTIGRFIDAFDEPNRNCLYEIYRKEIKYYSNHNTELVEVYFRNSTASTLNLIPQDPITDSIVCVGVNGGKFQELKLTDVLVGLDNNDHIFFRNANSGKYIKFVSFSNLNVTAMPALYRFLIEISYDAFVIEPLIGFLNILRTHSIQPRVVYKNIVISPMTLRINASQFDAVDNKIINDFLHRYIRNDYVYMKNLDNRLLLDTRSKECMSIIVEELNKNRDVEVSEAEGFIQNLVDDNDSNLNRIGELIIPYEFHYGKYNETYSNNKFPQPHKKRIFRIGSEWITFNIYCENSSQSYLLTKHIFPTIRHLLHEHAIDKFFYIRYCDDANHIRLRIRVSLDGDFYYKSIYMITNDLYETDLVKNITLNEYEREIERYGGDICIKLYEDFFMYNSILSIELLEEYEDDNQLDIAMTLLIMRLLDLSGLTYEQINGSLIKHNNRLYSSDYRKNKKDIQNLYIESKTNSETTLNKLYSVQMESALKYFRTLNTVTNDSNQMMNVIWSCIHMFCNRVYGIEIFKEMQIYAYLYYFMGSRKHLDIMNIEAG
jgi:thiopeptide-type bacteriocin biosynthesis protein